MNKNVLQLNDVLNDLSSGFRIERYFPSSYNWMGTKPRRQWLIKIQLPFYLMIPFISPLLSAEYYFYS